MKFGGNNGNFAKVSCKVGEISVFMKNPNNNPGNYCKSLFLETDET